MMEKVNVAGESFVSKLAKSFEIAREKGVEVPIMILISKKKGISQLSLSQLRMMDKV